MTSAPKQTTAPDPVPIEPAPGWISSEFIATVLVHMLSLLAILLDLLHVHWSKGMSSAQAAIPIAALLISSVLQIAYQNHRTALKMKHVAEFAAVKVAQAKEAASVVVPAAELGEQVASAVAPKLRPFVEMLDLVISRIQDATSDGTSTTTTTDASSAPPSVVQNVVVNTGTEGESQPDVEPPPADPTAVYDPRQ